MLNHVKLPALPFLIALFPVVALVQTAQAQPNQAQSNQAQSITPIDSKLALRQLIWPLESSNAFLNGQRVTTTAPSRVVSGRAFLPLRETSRLLDLELQKISGSDGLRFGKLDIYPNQRAAKLDGKTVPLSEVAVVLNGVTYVVARSIETAVPASLAFDAQQRLLRLTISNRQTNAPRLPVARFATDKPEYKLGEPVRIIEYSYDPDGVPLTAVKYVGREEAFFTAGTKTIALTVTNSNGKISEPYSVQIKVSNESIMGAKEFALRKLVVGKTFVDTEVLSQPLIQAERNDDNAALIVSDSPEEPDRSGVLYADTISGAARLLAYHSNGAAGRARLLVVASNQESDSKIDVGIERLGETAATQVVATLGQVSLLDFLLSPAKHSLQLGIDQSAPIYLSPPLERGEGLSLMMDLKTNGAVRLHVIFVEESLVSELSDVLNNSDALQDLIDWPILEMDQNHVRGTFKSMVRNIKLDLASVPLGGAVRFSIGDNKTDPALQGTDQITGRAVTLLGNFGLTYRLELVNAFGTVGGFVPRGGPYSGAIKVANLYQALPESGVLYRQDTLALLYRHLARGFEGGDQPRGNLEMEFVPANGSYLPVSFVFYRLETMLSTQSPIKKL